MNTSHGWMLPFLTECLAAVPCSPYRDQVRQELIDHLKTAEEALEAGGHDPREARQLALSRMGDPAELSRTFLNEYKRREAADPAYCAWVLWSGCVIAGFIYLFVAPWIMGLLIGYRNFGPVLPLHLLLYTSMPYELACALYRGFFGLGMFLLPYGAAARYTMRHLRFNPHRVALVTLGLWVAWTVEKLGGLLLGLGIYGHYSDLTALVDRICGGGDGFAPWFTVPYILLTFVGCPVLALIASLLTGPEELREQQSFA